MIRAQAMRTDEATGPTSAITFYMAALQIENASEQVRKIPPGFGGLKSAETSHAISPGIFYLSVEVTGKEVSISFPTAEDTSGSISRESSLASPTSISNTRLRAK